MTSPESTEVPSPSGSRSVPPDRTGGRTLRPRESEEPHGLGSLLLLRETRQHLRGWRGKSVAVAIGGVYALVALWVGSMLVFLPTGASGISAELLVNSSSPQWWNFPALVMIAPGAILVLPLFETVTMLIAAVGVGLGMGAGLLAGVRIAFDWKRRRLRPRGANSLSGLTPALVASLTLGACCSTTAAAAAGLGAVATASGVSLATLTVNAWYLNVFQIVVLAVALLAQEQLLTIYAELVTATGPERTEPVGADRSPLAQRGVAGLLRGLLVVGGTVWSVSLLLDVGAFWGSVGGAAAVAGATPQHLVPGVACVAAGLYPGRLREAASNRKVVKIVAPWIRGALLALGASIAIGVPPPLNEWGFTGTINAALAAAGLPTAAGGAVLAAGSQGAAPLVYAAVFAQLGIFVLVLGWAPGATLRALAWNRPWSAHLTKSTAGARASPPQ